MDFLKKEKSENSGFTLVELFIVIAIIAILLAVLAPGFFKYVDRSRWSADQKECSRLMKELSAAVADNEADDIEIKVTSQGTSMTGGKNSAEMEARLTRAYPEWKSLKIRHKNTYETESDGKKYNVAGGAAYTITYTASTGQIKGTWETEKQSS